MCIWILKKGDEILIKQSVEKVEEEQNRAEQSRTEQKVLTLSLIIRMCFYLYMQLKHVFLY